MRRLLIIGLAAAVALLGGGAAGWAVFGSGYQVNVLLGSADKLTPGEPVMVNGFQSGKIENVSAKDGKALLALSMDDGDHPLHDGASVTVEWKAVLGERLVEIKDGPAANPVIPNGGMIPGKQLKPTNLDEVLNALDPPTRQHVASLVKGLNNSVTGHEHDANATIRSAGPALQGLGEVLNGIGGDGQSIRDLVTQLNSMTGTLSRRDSDVRDVVEKLSRTTSAVAAQRQQLGAAVKALPPTLDTANSTLGKVPGAAGKAVPLLRDAEPATRQLPATANNLTPVLRDLRPTVQRLNPTLDAAKQLLNYTPGLLNTAQSTLPRVTGAANYLEPVLNYLRPYTPEAAGWLSEWASNGSNYDSNGHFVRFQVQEGATTVNSNPGVPPPGAVYKPYPKPGENVGQPWTDAWGGGLR